MVFNVFALLFAGKAVEKKIGSLPYLLLYRVIAIVNAIIMCVIFPNSTFVGASAGIWYDWYRVCYEMEKRYSM